MYDIDFVITYLDANDPAWQRERNRYKYGETADVNPNRYRDWDNLQYLFRGIEKYAPWVRKVHVVTCGHVPTWLNISDPRINIVKHADYIPEKWLPTFSSRCIDMNLHRIPDLAEHFVYFNDDMFLTAPVKPEDFFVNGLPCDAAIISPMTSKLTYGVSSMYMAPMVGTAVINEHFDKKEVIAKHLFLWMNLKYGKELLRTIGMLPYPNFVGFYMQHLPYSYLKSSYEEVWEVEPDLLTAASEHKFREVMDLNHYIFSFWQFVTGKFYPRSLSFGKLFQLHDLYDGENAAHAICTHKYKVVCLNDAVQDAVHFEEVKMTVNQTLDRVLEHKSMFETKPCG